VAGSATRIAFYLCLAGAVITGAVGTSLLGKQGGSLPVTALLAGCALFAACAGLTWKGASEADQSTIKLERQAELALQQVESQRKAIDSLADGLDVAMFVCNAKGIIRYANRRAVDMFRIETAVDKSLLAMTLNYELEQMAMEATRTGIPQTAELSFSYPTERVGIAKSWVGETNPDQAFVSIYEITDLRRLERIRQDFVSNVSHELRTPLTIIRSMAETLLDDPVPDPELSAKYLPRIVSEVDRLSTISNDLLILSAAESTPVRKSTCDISAVFRDVLDQLTPKAHRKGIQTSFEGPAALQIEANPAQLTQVAMNLVENAINYTNEGSVRVAVDVNGPSAIIQVADTGLGIASEHLPRIFERFYRIDKARSRHTGGTGLGLSIARHIVEAHGGRISVNSKIGEGSVFRVELPIGSPTVIADPESA
jgi:two-component system phosphate regulon sensor histidine kinase PhoR